MATVKQIVLSTTGLTLYANIIRDSDLYIWNGSSMSSFVAGSVTSYAVSMTETPASSARYQFTIPSTLPSGSYTLRYFDQAGASPAIGDEQVSGAELLSWDGSSIVPPTGSPLTSGTTENYCLARAERCSDIVAGQPCNLQFQFTKYGGGAVPVLSGASLYYRLEGSTSSWGSVSFTIDNNSDTSLSTRNLYTSPILSYGVTEYVAAVQLSGGATYVDKGRVYADAGIS